MIQLHASLIRARLTRVLRAKLGCVPNPFAITRLNATTTVARELIPDFLLGLQNGQTGPGLLGPYRPHTS